MPRSLGLVSGVPAEQIAGVGVAADRGGAAVRLERLVVGVDLRMRQHPVGLLLVGAVVGVAGDEERGDFAIMRESGLRGEPARQQAEGGGGQGGTLDELAAGAHGGDQARRSLMTVAGSTPVSRWSSPCERTVKRWWSKPNRWRTEAWRSRTWTGSRVML